MELNYSTPSGIKPFAQIREVTGEVIMQGMDFTGGPPPGEGYVVFQGMPPPDHYWSFADGMYKPIGTAPGQHHTWDWASHQWVFKASVRDDIWNLISGERVRRMAGGVKVGDVWFHSDQISRSKYVNVILSQVVEPNWKAMGQVWLEMNESKAREVLQAIAANDKAIFDASIYHRERLNQQSDPTQYDWYGDWPQTYQEATTG